MRSVFAAVTGQLLLRIYGWAVVILVRLDWGAVVILVRLDWV